MIDFIVKLENALSMAGIEWETIYLPEPKAYVLKIDGDAVYLLPVKEEDISDD